MKRKIKKYEKLILEILAAEVIERKDSEVKDIVIADKQTHHYMLFRTGWDEWQNKKIFVHELVIHFHIAEDTGKIWLLANNTDVVVTEPLHKAGIPASEIVLGFHSPLLRTALGYAEN